MRYLEDELKSATELPKISDKIGNDLFDTTYKAVVNELTAATVFHDLDNKRLGDTLSQHYSAYAYLALGFRLIELSNARICYNNTYFCAAELFHFSGHAFRGIGQLNRAADAYWRSGVIGSQDKQTVPLSIRSLARAKACCSEIGETEKSDIMHCLEWELRKTVSAFPRKAALQIWKITSGYGTSTRRWIFSFFILVIVFSATYELIYFLDKSLFNEIKSWTHIITPLYYCIVTTTTVGYGDIYPTGWLSQFIVSLNIINGYILLLIGATILGRKILGR